MNSTTQTENRPTETTSDEKRIEFGDLSDDCLIRIFKNFSDVDLFNVVDYDNRVVNAARYTFGKKFANELFTITNEFYPHREENSWSMKFLKYFGGVITRLRVKYNDIYRQIDLKIDNLILSHCCKSLMEIEFINADLFTMVDINESFQEVRKVTFIQSKCGYLISNFGKWFPKADTLYLEQQSYQDYAGRLLIEQHHPALKHFKIINTQISKSSRQQDERKISNNNITNFIRLNPQLKSLWIVCDKYELVHDFDGIKWDYELLVAIQSELSKLETLHIELNLNGNDIRLPKLRLNNLKNISTSLADLNMFLIPANKIESLNLLGGLSGSDLLKLPKTFSNIKALNLSQVTYILIRADNIYSNFDTVMISCAPKLQLLTELHCRYEDRPQTVALISSMLNAFKQLNMFVINAFNVESSKMPGVREALGALSSANIDGWGGELHDDLENERTIRLIVKKRI